LIQSVGIGLVINKVLCVGKTVAGTLRGGVGLSVWGGAKLKKKSLGGTKFKKFLEYKYIFLIFLKIYIKKMSISPQDSPVLMNLSPFHRKGTKYSDSMYE
jgi:hypothetical protein